MILLRSEKHGPGDIESVTCAHTYISHAHLATTRTHARDIILARFPTVQPEWTE